MFMFIKTLEHFQVSKGFSSTNASASAASSSGEDFTTDYSYGYTPMILSQAVNGTEKNLFRGENSFTWY